MEKFGRALLNYNLDSLWKDTEEALLIGKQIGDSIIVMSTSTGGTLSTFLCSRHPEIKAQILMSPNIALADPQSWLLNNHWGLQIARRVLHTANIDTPRIQVCIIIDIGMVGTALKHSPGWKSY